MTAICAAMLHEAKSVPTIKDAQCRTALSSLSDIDICPGKNASRLKSKCRQNQTLREDLRQLTSKLQETKLMAVTEIRFLKKTCAISGRQYRKCGIKDLNPRGKVPGLPKGKKAKQLQETAWWLTSMFKAALEVNQISKLKDPKLICQLEDDVRYVLSMLRDLRVKVRAKSSLCYRKHSTGVLWEEKDFSQKCSYAYLVMRDIHCGLNQIIDSLSKCKINDRKVSRKNRKQRCKKVLKCRKLRSIFSRRKGKKGNIKGCPRRRKLISPDDMSCIARA